MIESLEYEFRYVPTDSLAIHPMANIMPDMDNELFEELAQDIGTFGVKTPIMILKGTNQIIDGRHRWKAASKRMVDTVPIVEVEPEAEGLDFFIMSLERYRKNTTASQIAMIASALTAKIVMEGKERRKENLKQNSRKDAGIFSDEPLNETESKVNSPEKFAKELGIGTATLKDANRITELGTEEDVKEVIEGKVSVKKKVEEVRERKAKITFNKQNGASIEWAMWSWNPITGCEHTCKYCYAREMAERFRGTPAFPNGFEHTFYPERLEAPKNTKLPSIDTLASRNVFMGSMTDFWGAWQDRDEQLQVIKTMGEFNQWNYLSLTKDIWNVRKTGLPIPKNMWIGATVDNKKVLLETLEELEAIKNEHDVITWISFEPMFTEMAPTLEKFKGLFPDWFVIGGASNTKNTPAYNPPFNEICAMYGFTKKHSIALYMKDNLIERVKEMPEEDEL